MGSLAISPRTVGVSVGLSSAHPGHPIDDCLIRLFDEQFYVVGATKVRGYRFAVGESAAVGRSIVHALAADHGRKAKTADGLR